MKVKELDDNTLSYWFGIAAEFPVRWSGGVAMRRINADEWIAYTPLATVKGRDERRKAMRAFVVATMGDETPITTTWESLLAMVGLL